MVLFVCCLVSFVLRVFVLSFAVCCLVRGVVVCCVLCFVCCWLPILCRLSRLVNVWTWLWFGVLGVVVYCGLFNGCCLLLCVVRCCLCVGYLLLALLVECCVLFDARCLVMRIVFVVRCLFLVVDRNVLRFVVSCVLFFVCSGLPSVLAFVCCLMVVCYLLCVVCVCIVFVLTCCLLLVVGYLPFVVCGLLFCGCCVLRVIYHSSRIVLLLVCRLFVVCCSLCLVLCLACVAWCLLRGVCC